MYEKHKIYRIIQTCNCGASDSFKNPIIFLATLASLIRLNKVAKNSAMLNRSFTYYYYYYLCTNTEYDYRKNKVISYMMIYE